MFDFSGLAGLSPSEFRDELIRSASALVAGEDDGVANMANIASLVWHSVPELNWAGFYRVVGEELVLGPFMGKPACIRIAMGSGVCGAAAQTGETQCVPDVHAFPGHIACDAVSRSELVVPVLRDGKVAAVLDLDSPVPSRFAADDVKTMEALVRAVANAL